MIYSTGVNSVYIAAPSSPYQALGVTGNCRLKGLFVVPKGAAATTAFYSSAIALHDSTTSDSGALKLTLGYGPQEGAYSDVFKWVPIPGNGILFDNGIWVDFGVPSADAASEGVQLVYQQ
tara:strand:- start:421 stop:780 length:360 start_codon:yes stop_codon:yes gene_type:complete